MRFRLFLAAKDYAGLQSKLSHQWPMSTFHELTSLALDQIAFPVPRHQSFINFWWAVVNAYHVRNLASTVFSSGLRTSLYMTMVQPSHDFCAQLSSGHGIDGRIDRFVRNLKVRFVRVRRLKCARNLLWGISPFQIIAVFQPKCVVRDQPFDNSRLGRQLISSILCTNSLIAAADRGPPSGPHFCGLNPTISIQFTSNGRCTSREL